MAITQINSSYPHSGYSALQSLMARHWSNKLSNSIDPNQCQFRFNSSPGSSNKNGSSPFEYFWFASKRCFSPQQSNLYLWPQLLLLLERKISHVSWIGPHHFGKGTKNPYTYLLKCILQQYWKNYHPTNQRINILLRLLPRKAPPNPFSVG